MGNENGKSQEVQDKKKVPAWHHMDVPDVLEQLGADEETGLTADEAKQRLQEYGPNKLPDAKKQHVILRFLSHFHNVLIYILLAAAVVTALLDHWIDTWVILVVVVINAVIGFIQEGKAEKALDAIRDLLSPKAQVIRDNSREEIDAEELVPGDIVLLSAGDKMPADLRLVDVSNLRVEESALTGESEAVGKQTDRVAQEAGIGDRKCMAYSATTARYGTAKAVVVATGSETELGKINTMMAETEDMTTPLIQKINRFGKGLSLVILAFAAVLFAYGMLVRAFGLGELFLAIIGMAVAAIPEGLPAILTITLAIGVQRMAQRNAIVRKLPSVETLGSVTVICSDKTGTLTKNEMTAKTIYTYSDDYSIEGAGYDPVGGIYLEEEQINASEDPILSKLVQANFYCNNAEISQNEDGLWDMRGQPTEGALLTLAYKAGLKEKQGKRLDAVPFDSSHKFSVVLQQLDEERLILMNGAPDRLIGLCRQQLTPDGPAAIDADFWEKKIDQGAEKGQRMLGSAYRLADDTDQLDSEDLGDMVFIGLVGIIDPPRPEAIEAIKECQNAGIRIKMITGDHAITARVIGKEMGIGDGKTSVTGAELETMSDSEMQKAAAESDIFARTSPEHKLRLVRALQANDEICAMTGDGVNDAPALKQAEIGIAMGIKGTEVTKDAAAMVLADDNFASIANAVEEGRTIYDNLRKTLLFMLPTNGAEALVVTIGILIGTTMPITPVQILWVNTVTAVTLALAITVEPMSPGIMDRPPREKNAPILGLYFIWRIVFVSVMVGAFTFITFTVMKNAGHDIDVVRTIAVNTLVAGQLFYVYNCRNIIAPAFGKSFFQNKIVFVVSGVLVVLQLGLAYLPFMNELFGTAPLKGHQWLYSLGAGLVVFLLVEIEKAMARSFEKKKGYVIQ